MKLMIFMMISSAIIIGLYCASIHERVLAKVTNVFNKIVAFLVGAAATAWVWALLLGTYAWSNQPGRYRNSEELFGIWAGLGLVLVCGIVVIGLTTTLADIREKLCSLERRPVPDPIRVSPGGLKGHCAPDPVRVSTQSAAIAATSPYPSEPTLTDEEKAEIAQNLVREAQLKSMPIEVDEDSPTNP
jgi:hypothetical protein